MIQRLVHTAFLLLSFFAFERSFAQDLYNVDSIRTVEIFFSESNWDYLLDSMAQEESGTGTGKGRLSALVIIDGVSYDSVGVRYKGNSTYDPTRNKNPLNLKLDDVHDGQHYLGRTKIKLANGWADPTMVREALMYELSNQYMDCPRASFVRVYINGDYKGVYTNTESVDDEFLEQFFASTNNPFFKCDPRTFDIYGDNSNLAYHADSLAYDTLYDRKSDHGLSELQALCYELENNPGNIEQFLDVDKVLWFHAVSSAFVHLDGYVGFAHNYYLYKMDNGRWSIILWDTNMSFGGLPWNGQTWLPLSSTQMQELDPFIYEPASDHRPLIAQLMQQPRYRKMYVAHMRTILEENVNNEHYLNRALYLQSLIDADAQVEPYGFYSYSDFIDNVYTDHGTFFELRAGLESLMSARESYLYGIPEFQALQPTIVTPTVTPAQPDAYATATITASVADADDVFLSFRHSQFDVFTSVQMLDDGMSGDGAAGDGVYGASIPTASNDIQYYIYAENADAGKFLPVRAAYEYLTISISKEVVINELQASNTNTQQDQDGEYNDWIELYNNTTQPISLNGYYLSDDAGNPTKWAFPDTTIGAGAYLIVWADNDTLQSGLHANFKLSSNGEGVILYQAGIGTRDEVMYGAQQTDLTFGRSPNGTGNFTVLTPTFSAYNSDPVGVAEAIEARSLFLFPNPSSEQVTVQDLEDAEVLMVADVAGRIVHRQRIVGQVQVVFNVGSWNPGIYVVFTDDGRTQKLVVQ